MEGEEARVGGERQIRLTATMNRRLVVLVITLLALVSCDHETEIQRGFNVAADESLLGAAIQLDGGHVGTLQHLMLHGSWYEKLLVKIYGESPAAHMVAANVILDSEADVTGERRMSILKNGTEVASGIITIGATPEFQFYFVNGRRVYRIKTPPD